MWKGTKSKNLNLQQGNANPLVISLTLKRQKGAKQDIQEQIPWFLLEEDLTRMLLFQDWWSLTQANWSFFLIWSELQLQYLVERQDISRAIDAVINAVFESSKSLRINSPFLFSLFCRDWNTITTCRHFHCETWLLAFQSQTCWRCKPGCPPELAPKDALWKALVQSMWAWAFVLSEAVYLKGKPPYLFDSYSVPNKSLLGEQLFIKIIMGSVYKSWYLINYSFFLGL